MPPFPGFVKSLVNEIIRSDADIESRREMSMVLAMLLAGEGHVQLVPLLMREMFHGMKRLVAALFEVPGPCRVRLRQATNAQYVIRDERGRVLPPAQPQPRASCRGHQTWRRR